MQEVTAFSTKDPVCCNCFPSFSSKISLLAYQNIIVDKLTVNGILQYIYIFVVVTLSLVINI